MNWIQKVITLYKNNPEGYWFKRLLSGWCWVPVRWPGWLIVIIGLAFAVLGVYVGDYDDAPGAALIGVLLMLALIYTFGYLKGEKSHQ